MKVAISKVPERHQVQGLPNLGADKSLKKAGKSKKKKKKIRNHCCYKYYIFKEGKGKCFQNSD